MSGSSHKGEGVGSTVRTDRHTVYGWGRWWINEEVFEQYRRDQVLKKRARKAGFDFTQVDDYLETAGGVHDAVHTSMTREKRMAAEFRRLKKKYDLPKNANRMHLKAIFEKNKDPEIAKFLQLRDQLAASDAEKIARIRKLYLSGKNPYDILYETALIVGINLRKKA